MDCTRAVPIVTWYAPPVLTSRPLFFRVTANLASQTKSNIPLNASQRFLASKMFACLQKTLQTNKSSFVRDLCGFGWSVTQTLFLVVDGVSEFVALFAH